MWDMSFGPVFVILSQAARKVFKIVLSSFKLRITWLDICHVELWTQHVTTLSRYNCNRARDAARDAAASRVPGMFFCFLFFAYYYQLYLFRLRVYDKEPPTQRTMTITPSHQGNGDSSSSSNNNNRSSSKRSRRSRSGPNTIILVF